MKSKNGIYFGVKGKEVFLPKGSDIWRHFDPVSKKKGYSFLGVLYSSHKKVPEYCPFVSDKHAFKLGIV